MLIRGLKFGHRDSESKILKTFCSSCDRALPKALFDLKGNQREEQKLPKMYLIVSFMEDEWISRGFEYQQFLAI